MPGTRDFAVVFDAVGTLIEPDPPAAEAYLQAARRWGSRLALDEIQRRFALAMRRQERRDVRRQGRTSARRERARWRAIVRETIPDASDPQALFAALWEHFARPDHWRLARGAAECLEHLQRSGARLAIASNFDGRLHAIVRGLPELSGRCAVFVASELGVVKPHVDFFRRVAAGLQLPATSLCMVGDRADHDYWPPRAAGWHSVLLQRGGLAESSGDVPLCVGSLEQLPAIVEKRLRGLSN
jgi:putative hydrolase of the HAD superfamily